ncbi:melatonin receptor type 1A-like [Pomacea canaliculata]|uniref:melatonin receptor type 1A-like n=1 Tax=Pomacea canaliculata TaxID=400727 RepID=UPI000D72C591|nr:melatonin receptor type 1A-like [Pomacea canaliculata]
MLAFVASVASLNSITFNRYIRVCRPAQYDVLYSPAGQVLHIGGVWLFSTVLSLPPLFGWGEYEYVPTQYFCYCKWGSSLPYAIFMIVVCFGGTSTMMTSCYLSIYRTYTRSNRTISASGNRLLAASLTSFPESGRYLRNYVMGSRNSFSPGISRRSEGPRRQGSSISLTKYAAQWRHNSSFLHKAL